jgi:WD40 repeat protein
MVPSSPPQASSTVQHSTATSTAHPSATLTQTPTIVPTQTRTRIPTATTIPATAQAWATLESIRDPCDDDDRVQAFAPAGLQLSPDGEWVVHHCLNNDLVDYTIIRSFDGEKTYRYFFRNLYHTDDGYLPSGWVRAMHWSIDGRFVYLALGVYDIDGAGPAFRDAYAIYRLHLSTGKLVEILGNPPPLGAYAASFSADSRWLAYSARPYTIFVRDLSTGTTQQYTIDESFVLIVRFLWSPDSNYLVIAAYQEEFDYGENSAIAIFLLNLATSEITLLVHDPPLGYIPREWLSPSQIRLGIFFNNEDLPDMIYDLETGEMMPMP